MAPESDMRDPTHNLIFCPCVKFLAYDTVLLQIDYGTILLSFQKLIAPETTFIMKYILLLFFAFSTVCGTAQENAKNPLENVVITSSKNKTQVRRNSNGELLINVSKKDVLKFKTNGSVRYSDFGVPKVTANPMIWTRSSRPMRSRISTTFP